MTATLDDIHRNPAIIDQAIARGERLEILSNGAVTATLVSSAKPLEPDFLERAKRIWVSVRPACRSVKSSRPAAPNPPCFTSIPAAW